MVLRHTPSDAIVVDTALQGILPCNSTMPGSRSAFTRWTPAEGQQ